MARIVPGVQVTVVKDVVPQQLAPSGVLGLVGIIEKASTDVQRASSWNRLVEACGPGTAYSLPEARQALDNGVFQVVVSPVSGGTSATATLPSTSGGWLLTARSAGPWANGLRARVTVRRSSSGETFDLEIQRPGTNEWETHRQLTGLPGSPQYVVDALARGSSLAVAASTARFLTATNRVLKGGDTGDQSMVLVDDGQGSTGTNPILALRSLKNGPDVKVTSSVDDKGVCTVTLSRKEQAAADFVQVAVIEGLRFPGSESRLAQELRRLRDQKPEGQRDFELVVTSFGLAQEGPQSFAGGKDASAADYADALQRLKDEPDVDMVLAALQDFSDGEKVKKVYGDVISHCQVMSADCKGRLGFGQVPADAASKAQVDLARALLSDRFVLVSPSGTVGAVAGMVGSLPYFHSPTFKRVSGLGRLKPVGLDDQNTLVGGNVVTVALESSKGVVVLRGLTTDGDQINVRRTADRAVRGVKMLGDLFIGTLNTANGRSALKQKLSEFLLQMEKEGALVPSTDGSDPAFKVDVYSSQADFALGIVRVDIAVRPVRAMDFIYATIQIQT